MAEFGVKLPPGDVTIDFPFVMQRMRDIRAKIRSVHVLKWDVLMCLMLCLHKASLLCCSLFSE